MGVTCPIVLDLLTEASLESSFKGFDLTFHGSRNGTNLVSCRELMSEIFRDPILFVGDFIPPFGKGGKKSWGLMDGPPLSLGMGFLGSYPKILGI